MRKNLLQHQIILNKNPSESLALIFYRADLARHHLQPNQKTIMFTMWESTVFPSTFVDVLKQVDWVIVPCSWNYKNLSRQINKPIYVCNLGVDTDFYKFREPEKEPQVFKFIMPRCGNYRKGYDLVLQAFIEEFGEDEPVQLTMKGNVPFTIDGVNPKPEYVQYWDRKNIRWIDDNLSREDLYKLLAEHNAMVFPSRGEGWGLPVNEALAVGMPVIVSQFHAFEDFKHKNLLKVKSYKVPARFTPSLTYLGGKLLNPQHQKDQFLNVGHWYEADIGHLRKRMRELVVNWRKYLDKIYLDRELTEKEYSHISFNLRLAKFLKQFAKMYNI